MMKPTADDIKPAQRVMTLAELARALHGELSGRWINIRGPGHSGKDRSLGVLVDPKAPDGFWVYSLAGDDPAECRAHVLALLQKLAAGDSLTVECNSAEGDEVVAQFRIKVAKSIWHEAQPIQGTLAESYLSVRGCQLTKAVIAADALRFHLLCPFGTHRFPAMIALMRDVISGEPVGIHRTALRDDGLAKRAMPDGMDAKMMMGRAKGAALMLQHVSTHLGIAEGIETALSASQIFKIPVWAAMSATGLAEFTVIHGLEELLIFADHDERGLRAARTCAREYQNKTDTEVRVRCPSDVSSDWNDFLVTEHNKHGNEETENQAEE